MTHNKNKFAGGELLLESRPRAIIFGPNGSESVRAQTLQALTGFDDAALRRLGYDGAIPKPMKAKWPLQATIVGLFQYLRKKADRISLSLPVFPSMESCEGSGYFSKRFLQLLKSSGLPGFENTRVDFNKIIPALEPWLAGTPESDKRELQFEGVTDYAEMGEKYKAKLAKHQFAEAKGQSVTRSAAVETIRVLQSIHFHGYDRLIEELPSAMAGRDAGHIRQQLAKYVAELRQAELNEIARIEKDNAAQVKTAKPIPA